MKQGKCINYNFCSLALKDVVINITESRDSLCKECKESLVVIEQKNQKKSKFKRKIKSFFREAKREGTCSNDKNCNIALRDKVIKIYDKEDTNCRECNRPLNIRKVEKKVRRFNIINFKTLFFLTIFLFSYFFITTESIDIIELKSKVEFLKDYHDELKEFLGEKIQGLFEYYGSEP